MTTTPRITPAPITGIKGALVKRFSKKVLGRVPESMGVMWHNRDVLFALAGLGGKVQKWHRLDPNLQSFAHMAVAAYVGCSWCLDYNYFHVHNAGLDEAKASEVPRWRESDVFTSLERDVLEYAEAMSASPPAVTDELSARLLDQLGEAALIELTALVGFANLSTRSNVALGIESEEFSSACAIPLARPSAAVAS
ncbi:carboxymuconolactone decarboxylase family protein [Desertimonas flava]|uniref:carboxymuconolactone decarboxylase family protein n=1 Tax=Desertimonas flava TaxID=2064846 RepID=UPI000E350691|nr:carboxymuconolactone decarboxylase family protein [Desertimonas flava]